MPGLIVTLPGDIDITNVDEVMPQIKTAYPALDRPAGEDTASSIPGPAAVFSGLL